jgi:catechol 2,3-dioxygenase-like lactoylglutathione lyase family enzyme
MSTEPREGGQTVFTGVYHTGFLTDDIDKATTLWQATFGGRVVARVPGADGGQMVYITVGDVEIELMQRVDKSGLGGRTGLVIDHVGYFVPDLDRTLANLRQQGFEIVDTWTSATGYRSAYLDVAKMLGAKIHVTEERK